MWLKDLVKYPIFAGLVAIFLAIFPWLDWLSSIIIAIMVFADAITASLITLLIVSLLETWHTDFTWTLGALADQLSFYLIWLGALVLRKRSNWDTWLNSLAYAGLIAVLLAHLFIPHLHHIWRQKLSFEFNEIISEVNHLFIFIGMMPSKNELMINWIQISSLMQDKLVIKLLAMSATSLWIAGIVFSTLFNLGIARFWQHTVMGIGKLRDELFAFHLHRFFGVFMILCALLYWLRPDRAWILDTLTWTTLVTVSAGVLYACWQIARWPLAWLWGLAAIVVWMFFPLAGFILLSGLGTLDSLVNLRRLQV